MPSALATIQLLLNALRFDQTPDAWESERVRTQIVWDDLCVRAIVLGLAPLLHHQLRRWSLDVPARSAAKLAVTYQAHAQRNAAIYQQLGEVLSICTQRDVHPIALKGVHLASAFYPDIALRPMNDIDLLFTSHELPVVEALLQELGYGGKHKSPELGAGVTKHTSTFRRSNNHAATPNPYLSTDADRTIEPHISLEESWFGLKVDITRGVRERTTSIDLNGQSCRVLSREDLLLHLCVHYCFHLIMGVPSLVQLVDLLVVTQADNINWTAFEQRAISQRAAPYALAALTQAEKLLGARVPAETVSRLTDATPKTMRHRITQLDLSDILRRTQQKPLTGIRQRLLRGLHDRVETARWATDRRARLQVWKSALLFTRTDTARMLMKNLE